MEMVLSKTSNKSIELTSELKDTARMEGKKIQNQTCWRSFPSKKTAEFTRWNSQKYIQSKKKQNRVVSANPRPREEIALSDWKFEASKPKLLKNLTITNAQRFGKHEEFPRIEKARSAECMLTEQRMESANASVRSLEEADVSPLLMRRFSNHVQKPLLPQIESLRLSERRRSRSCQDLTGRKKFDLQKLLMNGQLSKQYDEVYWSKHWIKARDEIVGKRALPNLPTRNDNIHKVDIQKDEEVDSQKIGENAKKEELDAFLMVQKPKPKQLSLEERLLQIEKMHGLHKHLNIPAK